MRFRILRLFQIFYNSDYSNLRRNIIHKFERLVNSIDIDDLKDTFIGREVFDIPTFDRLEKKFENNREQATAAVLIHILKSGHAAVVTLIDSLYINSMDSLADELLAPIEWSDAYEQGILSKLTAKNKKEICFLMNLWLSNILF